MIIWCEPKNSLLRRYRLYDIFELQRSCMPTNGERSVFIELGQNLCKGLFSVILWRLLNAHHPVSRWDPTIARLSRTM